MPLLIHPGFHKTGTTWLQERVFSIKPTFNYLLTHDEVDQNIVRPHDLVFSTELASELIRSRRSSAHSQIDVISCEMLVGNPFLGSRDAAVLARRLKSIAPESKILLTVREQGAMLRSLYQQYVKRGGTLDIKDFLYPRSANGYFSFDPVIIHFHILAEYYADLFGEANVLVLPQELLARDRFAAIGHLLEFAEHTELAAQIQISPERSGESPPIGATGLMRFANHWRPSAINPGAPRRTAALARMLLGAARRKNWGGEHHLRKWTAAIEPLAEDCRASNRALQQYCPVPLDVLGYRT